ncbi:MAG TPA: GNAT family N-acetyltransferase [Puia sp.]|nr:GNAT family N-acetyltransferase [Puia sp.]
MSLRIRDAVFADLPQILGIYNEVIEHTTAVFSYAKHSLAMREDWFQSRREGKFPVYVAEDKGEILGFSSYGPFRIWPAYKYTVENSIYVAAAHRGKGLSKLLMQPLIDQAIRQQYHVVIAGIEASNLISIRLHESFGFIEVANFKEVGFKFGKWLDLKFLELILPTPEFPVETS